MNNNFDRPMVGFIMRCFQPYDTAIMRGSAMFTNDYQSETNFMAQKLCRSFRLKYSPR
jgi:hypothetical protein